MSKTGLADYKTEDEWRPDTIDTLTPSSMRYTSLLSPYRGFNGS